MLFAATPVDILAGAVLVALLVDFCFGEPPVRWHPVVWMGNYLGWAGRLFAPEIGKLSRNVMVQFTAGALAWCMGAACVFVPAAVLSMWVAQAHGVFQVLLLGMLLKPMLAWRVLRDEVHAVEQALQRSLPEGRQQVARLVSRDVNSLSETQVRQSAISTLAENLNDSVVAPLFWFAVLGLPGAAVYRFANTADAMWGYRGERAGRDWTWAGKWAARADDVLSWVPARITALLICLLFKGRGLFQLPGIAQQTPSPNGGWPMGALALGMGIRLEKKGVYCLNVQGGVPRSGHIEAALHACAQVVVFIAVFCMVAVLWGVT
ncbi:adenosylcobinamide-phosphate synthase CbiB [Limnobacter sp.]|uniref:adenosylcobinamide-phosphate synthase CbiB n=1 Tax=Limnobacter sp. TaxID=2003368 RepID=UPI002FE20401